MHGLFPRFTVQRLKRWTTGNTTIFFWSMQSTDCQLSYFRYSVLVPQRHNSRTNCVTARCRVTCLHRSTRVSLAARTEQPRPQQQGTESWPKTDRIRKTRRLSCFLQRELYVALAVMGWCACVCMWVCYTCVRKSAQGAGKRIFRVVAVLDGGSTTCQKGVRGRDLELENEVKVRRSRNFN